MKKNFYFLLLGIILLFGCMDLSSAFYVRDHDGWIINGFQQINSGITLECRDRLSIVLDGQRSADMGVIYYGNADQQLLGTYVYPHTRGGIDSCFALAGSDLDLKCFCHGMAMHSVDDISHDTNGLVEKYLKKFLGSNYFGHMIVERSMETQNEVNRRESRDYAVTSGQLDYYNGLFLNNLFTETGGNSKYLSLIQAVAGVDMSNTARVFRSGYVGEGFYNSVYKDKVSLPLWAYGISIGLMAVGILFFILTLIFGKGKWKIISGMFYIIFAIIGGIVLFSFITGTTWKLTTFLTEVPATFGYLNVNHADIVYYNNLGQEYVNNYLRTGIVQDDDWSGLSYRNRNGDWVVGALSQAETGYKLLIYIIILPGFVILNIWMMAKTFGWSIKRRRRR